MKINKIIFTILVISIAALIFSGCGGITTPETPSDSLNAMITTTTTSGQAPLEVTFDASESTAAQSNEIVSYEWDFGDEKIGEGQTVQHGFDSPGNYTVILTIGDNKGAVDTSSVIIKVFNPTETVMEQNFNTQDGIEFDTGTGLMVSVFPDSNGGQKKLVVTENLNPQQLTVGGMKLQSVYSISLLEENVSEGQKMNKESFEKSINAELTFDIPAGLDPNFVIILEWADDGWILASSSDNSGSIDSLGGVIASGGKTISIELQHFSTYALSFVELNLGEPIVDIYKSEPLITSDGDMCIDLTLESTNWGIFNIGAWYQIDVPEGLWYKSINSPTDLSFGDWGKNKGFLGPQEDKKLQFTFWGNGGTAPIYLSVRDGWPMALRDYLVRMVGKNLEWPYPSREAMENDFINKCELGIATTVVSELINELVDELINVTSIQDGIRTLWKWMKKYGIGNWLTFIRTSKLAVDTVGHVLLNQGGYINYRLVGGIVNPLVKVKPTEVLISSGESVQFSSNLTTLDGNQILSINPYLKWEWGVSGGGSIDGNGLFIANNNTSGTYTIKAHTGHFGIDGEVHKVEGESIVTIKAPSSSLGQVQLSNPSNGATLLPGNITFSWNSVSNATKYEFMLYNSLGQAALDTTNSNTSLIVPLGTEETITWKVRAGDNNGNWGAWSDTWSLTLKVTQTQPAPQVTGVDPSQPTANPSRQWITILGNNFVSGAQITLQISSSVYPISQDRTQFIDSTRIKVYVGLTNSGYWKVWATNPDGQKSNEYSFYVKPTQPAPQVTGVDPSQPTANPSRQWITILGNNFVSGAQITLQISSSVYPISQDRTQFIDSTRIKVYVGLTDSGYWKVWATNPDGQKSNEYSFYVKPTQPAPQVTGVDPSQPTANPSRQWITILGNNFVSGAQITLQISSSVYPISQDRTQFIDSTRIKVYVGLTDSGYWKVWATNPDGQKSNEYSFYVKPTQPAPQVTGVDPSQPTANPSRQWITILGNNFVSGAQITLQISSSVYPISQDRTQFIDSTRIKVYVGLTDSGYWKVWATNPDGQKSNEYSFYVKP